MESTDIRAIAKTLSMCHTEQQVRRKRKWSHPSVLQWDLAGSAKAPGLNWVGPEIRCKEGVSRISKEWHYEVGSLGGQTNTTLRLWSCGRGWSHINTTHATYNTVHFMHRREAETKASQWDLGNEQLLFSTSFMLYTSMSTLNQTPACFLASQCDLAELVRQIFLERCTPSWLQNRNGSKHLEHISGLKTNSCYWSRNYCHWIWYVEQTVLCLRVRKDERMYTVKEKEYSSEPKHIKRLWGRGRA